MAADDNMCDACGWAAAVGGMLAFGSFAVPIKSEVAKSLNIDPLVFQTYKTSMCFLTSWLILLYGENFTFTPWGIVSGMFWVPGGIGTIYAVQNAGLAIGIGVSSSFIVLVSFTWGIFIFEEHVHSRFGACLAVGCMMLGLLGMAYYSSPPKNDNNNNHHGRIEVLDQNSDTTFESVEGVLDIVEGVRIAAATKSLSSSSPPSSMNDETTSEYVPLANYENRDNAEIPNHDDDDLPETSSSSDPPCQSHVILCGMKWKRRTLGILTAIITGSYGGSIMVPMKWAPDDAKGLHYLISFAIGASLVNMTLWILRYFYLCQKHRSVSTAYYALPSFHFRKMWPYGATCGLVWSIGNFFSILSVQYLGEGVGYSVVQASILVSGLWGIFYFHEIRGCETMTKWLSSALVAVSGILLLSYEHHEK